MLCLLFLGCIYTTQAQTKHSHAGDTTKADTAQHYTIHIVKAKKDSAIPPANNFYYIRNYQPLRGNNTPTIHTATNPISGE